MYTCAFLRVCVCVREITFVAYACAGSFFLHLFDVMAIPNGMGVEAVDALLDEGPLSLPAMRL